MLAGRVESKVTRTGAKGRKAAAEPQRARRARAMSDLLPAAGGAAFRRFGFVQSSIVSRWQEIVGAALRRRLRARIDPLPAGQEERRRRSPSSSRARTRR